MRKVGTVSMGIRTPLIKNGDDLETIVVDSILEASSSAGFQIKDNDIIGITESLLARAQGNFVELKDIVLDIENKFGQDQEIGIIFPIFSRNRFSLILKAIAMGAKKVYVQLSYPKDEVGNPIVQESELIKNKINFLTDHFTLNEFRDIFGYENTKNPFTGIDIIDYYQKLNDNIEIIFSNQAEHILKYTKNIIVADIHTRDNTKKIIIDAKADKVFTLAEILNSSINGSGYNEDYGLLGSNYSTESILKLFPRNGDKTVLEIQKMMKNKTCKHVEVLIYGDGAFKDPIQGIWELADPVVSPFYTSGLNGTPSELKLKYIVDNENLGVDELKERIKNKSKTNSESLGTTPRKLTDLIGSLCDLTSGSGDKGTPVIYIQGYFDNYSTE